MKKLFPAVISALLLLNSCYKPVVPVPTGPEETFLSGKGFFVINEGNFMWGNGSLSYYSYDSSKIHNDLFEKINMRALGDVPNSMEILNDYGYVVVNNSGRIEVFNRKTMESVATISDLQSPRYIALINNRKAYVTSMSSNSLSIVDLSTNSLSGSIDIGKKSESIIVKGKKVFVASWVGDNRVTVIDSDTDQPLTVIETAMEPESMVLDKNGLLWVLCNGGWARENYAELLGINSETYQIVKRKVFPSKSDSPTNLRINGTRDTLFYLMNDIYRMSINDQALPEDPFISDPGHYFYKLSVNPSNGDIIATDAIDYQQKGLILIYTRHGVLKTTVQAGIIPGYICFKIQSDPVIQ